MSSKNGEESQVRIRKATEILQKIWWFSFYLVISPFGVAVVSYLIFIYLFRIIFVSLSLAVISYMFALLFFYKAFDKYRNNPFFLNKKNNLVARVHIVFLIPLLSCVVTPIFMLISPKNLSFVLLPLISFALLYNVVYFYFYFQPIDFYNIAENEFKRAINLKLRVMQPYNLIVVINYFFHIVFFSFTYQTGFSWFFALATNLTLYILTYISTKKRATKIKNIIKRKKSILQELTKFKQNFVLSITTLIFILLIQIPLIFVFSKVLITVLDSLNAIFLSCIFILFYFKSRVYIKFHYSSKINIYRGSILSDKSREGSLDSDTKYQKYNTLVSGLLIGLIAAFGFLINNPLLIVIILPFFFIFSYYEQKARVCPKRYNRYVLLLNSIVMLISISFGLFSQIILLKFQFLMFFLALYFVLQGFVKFKYFTKENIYIIQNVLAVASFTIIVYSFFKFENVIVFKLALFSSDPLIILFSNFLLHGILFFTILLISFYIFYSRVFHLKRSKLFRASVIFNIIFIEFFIFIFVILRISILVQFTTLIKIIILSFPILPTIFIFFVFINYIIRIFSRENFLVISYYLIWFLIANIFLSLFITFLGNYMVLALDFLILSVFCQLNLKFGLKLEKVKDQVLTRFTRINSYLMILEFSAFFLFLFYSFILIHLVLYENIVLSVFFSLLITTLLGNFLSRREIVLSRPKIIVFNVITLLFGGSLAFYFSFLRMIPSFYMFLYPFLILFIILFIPILYLFKIKVYEKILRRLLIIDLVLIGIFVSLIPAIIGLEFFRLGIPVEVVSLINYTLLLFPSIFLFIAFLCFSLKVYSQKIFFIRTYYLLWILIAAIFWTILTLSLFNFLLITLDLLFLSIFSQLNLKFGLKIERVKDPSVKQFARINSYIMTAELTFLFFFFFYYIAFISLVLYENIVLSIYCSLLITTVISNILSRKEIVFTKSITIKLNVISLIFSACLTFYYTFVYTFPTFYVLLIPFLCFFTIMFFPIYYLFKQRIYPVHIQKILATDCIIIAALLTTIPTIIGLDLYIRAGFPIDVVSIVNYTLYVSFGILTFIYIILKHYKMKNKYQNSVLKSQILIVIIIAGTTVFYYLYTIMPGFISRYHFPLIAASCFFYLPTIFAQKRRLFNTNLIKKTVLGNSILLSGLVILTPSVIGFDLARIGFFVDIFVITAITLTVLFVMLKYLDFIGSKLNLIVKRVRLLKLLQAFTWLSLSTFIGYVVFSYFPTSISISSSILAFFLLNIYTLKLLYDYSKELRFLDYLRECLYYGIIFSLSSLILTSILVSNLFNLLPPIFKSLNLVWYLGIFSLIDLLLIRYLGILIKFKFTKLKNGIEFTFWGIVKVILSFTVSYFLSYSIITKIVLFSVVFIFLTPTTLSYFKKLQIFSEKNQLIIKKITLGVFIILISLLYFEFLYSIAKNIPLSNLYTSLPFTIIPTNIYLFLYYCLLRFNRVIEKESNTRQYIFQFSSIVLFLSLFFMNFQIPLNILIVIPFFLILTKRSVVVIYRFLAYVFLSYGLLIALQPLVMIWTNLDSFSYFTQFYLISFSIVLFFSIWLNRKKNNNLEKYSLYLIISLLSFVLLFSYTKVPLLYNITISLFLFLAFMGIYLYRQKNMLYRWFIRPCALLLIFDFISFVSYSLLFNNPQYINFSPFLTFTLTMTITGFAFVFLYNKSPANFRKKSFYFILIAIIFCFPAFLYFFLIASLSLSFNPLIDPVPIIVAINVAVFLFYLCVGIYQWRISWAIWKSGWIAWNILPFANFLIIYKSLRGIDVLTNSIKLFGIWDLTGASILAFIICSLFFLPVFYTKIKEHFLKIIFFVWAESLFLLYWVSQNLFLDNILLRNLSFGLFSVILLLPFLVGIKYWKIASIIWIMLVAINSVFLSFYLSSLGIVFEITISIDILVVGLLLIVFSFFPNIRSFGIVLLISYSLVLIGIFVTIYFVLYSIILDPIFSINIGLLVMGISLFSSKYLKLKNRLIDLALSWLLIFNFSWLTFNTFSLFHGYELFAFFLALTVFGGTFFIFNHYKMKFRLNKIFPYFTIGIGASASISSLFSTLFGLSLNLSIGIFTSVFLISVYLILIEYRYILWFLIPIPITSFIFESIVSLGINWFLSLLILSIIYLSSFMILINIFKNFAKKEGEEITNSLFKLFTNRNQVKMINLISLLLNSFFISVFLSILFPILLQNILFDHLVFVYQILNFLTIWPIFILFGLKYIEKSEMEIKVKDPLLIFNRICTFIYLIIPFASALNLFLLLSYLHINIVIASFSSLLTLSGLIFIESYIVDRHLFYYLFNSLRNKFIFWSWSAFINIFCIFFYIFHSNWIFLILTVSTFNQISLYFLSYLDVSKEKITMGRMILLYAFFVSGSFYLSYLISNGLVLLFSELMGITYYTLLLQNSFLLLFISSYFFIRFKIKLKYSIESIFFITFQGLFALNWILVFTLLHILTLFSVALLILVETIFCFRTIKYLNILFFEEERPKFLVNAFSTFIVLLYFELSLLIYGLMVIFLGIFESILISQLVFFGLTLLEIYSLKRLKSGYAQIFHTISFFIISLMIFFIINQYASHYSVLYSIETLIFISMQFYTNYSFFKAISSLYAEKLERATKRRLRVKQILGIFFYGNLFFILLQSLIILNIELQMMLLSLSLLVHVLMILDAYLLKFLRKVNGYLRVISWILIMVFTTSYLLWFYIAYFLRFLLTSIPLIIFILLLEIVYLFSLLDFWKFVMSNKQKIRSVVIGAFYIVFIIWPLFLATSNLFLVLNLLISSLVIMFFLTLIDIYFKVVHEKVLLKLRKASFSIIGLLLSIDTYILLETVPPGSLLLSLSVSSLIFVIFLAIIINPFKRHPIIPFLFWFAIFSLLSSIIYHFSLSWEISVSVLSIIVLIYPFIFLLEELRKLFNKFLEYVVKFLRMLKQSIINAIKKIYHFIKTYFPYIWIPFSAFLAIFIGILLSPVTLNLLNWVHSTLLMFAIFGLLYLVIPSKATTDADVVFKRRILRLSIGWGSAISLLFILITPVWYIFTVLISIAVVGTITLVYLRRKEEREKISIKWRFYTLLALFILLIIFTILFIAQQILINI